MDNPLLQHITEDDAGVGGGTNHMADLYSSLKKRNPDMPDFNQFKSDMADTNNLKSLHESLQKRNPNMPDFESFKTDMLGGQQDKSTTSVTPTRSLSKEPKQLLVNAPETQKRNQQEFIRDKQVSQMKDKALQVFKSNPDFYNNPKNRDNFYLGLAKFYSPTEIDAIRGEDKPQELPSGFGMPTPTASRKNPIDQKEQPDIQPDLPKVLKPAQRAIESTSDLVKSGAKGMVETGEMLEKDGNDPKAILHGVVSMGKLAMAGATITNPEVATFTTGLNEVSKAAPKIGKAFTPTEWDTYKSLLTDKYTKAGKEVPIWLQDVGEGVNFLAGAAMFMGLHKGYKEADMAMLRRNMTKDLEKLTPEKIDEIYNKTVAPKNEYFKAQGVDNPSSVSMGDWVKDIKTKQQEQKDKQQENDKKSLDKALARTESPDHLQQLDGMNTHTTVGEMPVGISVNYKGTDGHITKSDAGEIVFNDNKGNETIVGGGGDTRAISDAGITLNEGTYSDKHGDYFVEKTTDGHTVYKITDGNLKPVYEGDKVNEERRNAIINKALNLNDADVKTKQLSNKAVNISSDIDKADNPETKAFLTSQVEGIHNEIVQASDESTTQHATLADEKSKVANLKGTKEKLEADANNLSPDSKAAIVPALKAIDEQVHVINQNGVPDHQETATSEAPKEDTKLNEDGKEKGESQKAQEGNDVLKVSPETSVSSPLKNEIAEVDGEPKTLKSVNDRISTQQEKLSSLKEGTDEHKQVSDNLEMLKGVKSDIEKGIAEAKVISDEKGYDSPTHLVNDFKAKFPDEYADALKKAKDDGRSQVHVQDIDSKSLDKLSPNEKEVKPSTKSFDKMTPQEFGEAAISEYGDKAIEKLQESKKNIQNKDYSDFDNVDANEFSKKTAKFLSKENDNLFIDKLDKAINYINEKGKSEKNIQRLDEGKKTKGSAQKVVGDSKTNAERVVPIVEAKGVGETKETPSRQFEKQGEPQTPQSEAPAEVAPKEDKTKTQLSKERLDAARTALSKKIGGSLQSGGLNALPEFAEYVKAFVDHIGNKVEDLIKDFRSFYPKSDVTDDEIKKAFEDATKEKENTVGISHEALNKLNKQLGLPEIKRGAVLSPKQYAEMGRKMLKGGIDPNTLLNSGLELEEKIPIARAYFEELVKQADAIKDKTSPEYKALEAKLKDYEENVVKKLGTSAGAAMRTLQGERDLTTDSFYEAEKTLKKSLNGAELTKEQTAQLQKHTEEIQSLKKKIEDLEKKEREAIDKELGVKDFVDTTHEKATQTRRQARIKKVDKFFDDAIASLSNKGVAYATLIPPDVIKVALKGMKEAYHAGEEISKIVEDAVKYISSKINKDWDKERFSKEYTDALGKITKDLTPEEKLLARKEKELSDLKSGIEKKRTPKEYNLTDEEKDKLDNLNQEIKDLKLGKITKDLQTQFANKKDNTFTREESKSLWNYGKEKYLNNDVEYEDMIKYVANDMGLTPDQVRHAIVSPKAKPISIEKWAKMSELRKNRSATQRYIDEQSESFLLRQAKKTSGDIRDIATFGHGHVFMGTHAGLTAFSNPQLWMKAYIKGVELSYKMTDGEVEQFTHDFENRPLYDIAQKSGLQNDLHKMGNDMELASQSHFLDLARKLHGQQGVAGKVGKVLVGGSEAGRKGFMAIKLLRQELWEQAYNNLTEEQKGNEEVLKSISRLMNNATGATNVKLSGGINEVIKEGLFAGGMEISRWEKIIKNPARAMLAITQGGLNAITLNKVDWIKKLPPEEQVFAKIWAKRVLTQVAVYGSLVAVSKVLFHKDDETAGKVITKDLGSSQGYKIKYGKDRYLDPTSGMVSSLALLGKIYKEVHKQNPKVGSVLMDYGRKKLAPTYQIAADVATGHDALGNAVPFRHVKPEHKWNKKLFKGEYLESKSPLPLAEGFQSANEAHNIGTGIVSGLISGLFGFKSYDKTPVQKIRNNKGEAEDKGSAKPYRVNK